VCIIFYYIQRLLSESNKNQCNAKSVLGVRIEIVANQWVLRYCNRLRNGLLWNSDGLVIYCAPLQVGIRRKRWFIGSLLCQLDHIISRLELSWFRRLRPQLHYNARWPPWTTSNKMSKPFSPSHNCRAHFECELTRLPATVKIRQTLARGRTDRFSNILAEREFSAGVTYLQFPIYSGLRFRHGVITGFSKLQLTLNFDIWPWPSNLTQIVSR